MAPTSPRAKKGGVVAPAGYGSIPSGPNVQADELGDGSFQQYLETFGMKMESDPYRLDIAKFILVSLIVAGNFVHPFAQLGNKVACVLENFVSIINVPAYVLLTGYMSATTNKTRRRYIIAHLLIPYLIVQSIYLALYIGLYWNNSFRSHPNGVDRKPGMFTDNWTPQPHFNGLSMMTRSWTTGTSSRSSAGPCGDPTPPSSAAPSSCTWCSAVSSVSPRWRGSCPSTAPSP